MARPRHLLKERPAGYRSRQHRVDSLFALHAGKNIFIFRADILARLAPFVIHKHFRLALRARK